MLTLCLFSSYFEQSTIPNYIKIYLQELSQHADELWFLTNEKKLSDIDHAFLAKKSIQSRYYPNQGYDFGQWYQAIQEIDTSKFDQLILANDSCILFRPLKSFMDWYSTSGLDYAGINDTKEINYHPQSFFIVVGRNAIPYVADYFARTKIISGKVEHVIESYEIGLPQYLLTKGLRVGAMISYKHISEEVGIDPSVLNPSLRAVKQLIIAGSPLVKRRFLMGDFKKNELFAHLLDTNFLFPPQLQYFINKLNPESNPLINSWSYLLSRYDNRKNMNSLANAIVNEAISRKSIAELLHLIHLGYWPMGWLSLLKYIWKSKKLRLFADGLYWTKRRLFGW
jgi:hypothetical protein